MGCVEMLEEVLRELDSVEQDCRERNRPPSLDTATPEQLARFHDVCGMVARIRREFDTEKRDALVKRCVDAQAAVIIPARSQLMREISGDAAADIVALTRDFLRRSRAEQAELPEIPTFELEDLLVERGSKEAVMEVIRDNPGLAVFQIAQTLGVARSLVSLRVQELEDEGRIRAKEVPRRRGGRPFKTLFPVDE